MSLHKARDCEGCDALKQIPGQYRRACHSSEEEKMIEAKVPHRGSHLTFGEGLSNLPATGEKTGFPHLDAQEWMGCRSSGRMSLRTAKLLCEKQWWLKGLRTWRQEKGEKVGGNVNEEDQVEKWACSRSNESKHRRALNGGTKNNEQSYGDCGKWNLGYDRWGFRWIRKLHRRRSAETEALKQRQVSSNSTEHYRCSIRIRKTMLS